MIRLQGKKVLLGITGGIAAYKCCELVRFLIKSGAEVKVVLTPSAKEFVTETTLRTLSKNPVYTEQFDVADWKPEHISLADSADVFVIAPATANTIGKIANGICDNLLTSLVAAFKGPIVFAPAMNCNMWSSTFVQKNVNALANAGCIIIPPEEGDLACGYSGAGRMAEVATIADTVSDVLSENKFLKGRRVLVTAGGTREEIDPVRYIGNYSSGKMGIAVADVAHRYGAEVTLVTTVNVEKPYKVVMVNSAMDMRDEVLALFKESDALVMTAAVADYRPKHRNDLKIKKTNSDSLIIELEKNPDILSEAASVKSAGQTVIGFCAESNNVIEYAKDKISRKGLDYIVANDISCANIGFNSDYNRVAVVDRDGNVHETEILPKSKIAEIILKRTLNGNTVESICCN